MINPVKSRVGGVDATFPSVFRRDGRHVVSQPRKSLSHYVFPRAPHLTNERTLRPKPFRNGVCSSVGLVALIFIL